MFVSKHMNISYNINDLRILVNILHALNIRFDLYGEIPGQEDAGEEGGGGCGKLHDSKSTIESEIISKKDQN